MTLPARDASKLWVALTSKKPARIATILAPKVKKAFLKNPKQLIPVGSNLHVLSFQMLANGNTATVPVKITGGSEAGMWLLTLMKSGKQWLLIGTVKE